jgi:hypothetical protein
LAGRPIVACSRQLKARIAMEPALRDSCPKAEASKGPQMGQARDRPLARVASVVIVLGWHLLLIAVLSSGRLTESRRVTADSQESLILIPLSPDVPEEQPERREKVEARKPPRIARDVSHSDRGAGAAPVQSAEPSAGAIDWGLEAERVAKSIAPGVIKELQRKCVEAEQRAQAPPEGCRKRSNAKEWEPEPKRAGVIGFLPYVRLGKCLVGLGFWGCSIGKQSPDGTLLDDMRNPDRPGSSVPDLPESRFAEPPVPQAFKESEQP